MTVGAEAAPAEARSLPPAPEKQSLWQRYGVAASFLAPALILLAVWIVYPTIRTIIRSFYDRQGTKFVWFDNFVELFKDPHYLASFKVTALFSFLVAGLGLTISLLLAVMADRVVRGATGYKTLLIWPYAVAPAVAGILWMFLFNPTLGVVAHALRRAGYEWNHLLNENQALLLIVFAAVWKQVSYNFLFFLAGLQSIPRSLIEAAAIDGAGPTRRFWTIVFPLLSPTTFFLMVVNIIAAFFNTFGTVAAITQGGPGKATDVLV
jgi:sn-glycerol 3-phosphate transport system permease protein